MKKIAYLFLIAIVGLSACNKDESSKINIPLSDTGIVPKTFKVDVPSSISSVQTSLKSGTATSSLSGGDLYEHLRTFVKVGESAAEVVEGTLGVAGSFIVFDREFTTTYPGTLDSQDKKLEFKKESMYKTKTYSYQLKITDVESQKVGLDMYWDNEPVVGIAYIDPYYIDTVSNNKLKGTLFQIEYSAEGNADYDETMTVQIENWVQLPIKEEDHKYRLDNLKMFAGKKGDRVDIYGNSTHPDAWFLDNTKVGYDWAFVASAFQTSDIAVAEVGLPPVNGFLDTRSEILETHSIKNVLTSEWNAINPGVDISGNIILKDAEAPGYFNASGFVQAATAPDESYNDLETAIETLMPYSPQSVIDLTISNQ